LTFHVLRRSLQRTLAFTNNKDSMNVPFAMTARLFEFGRNNKINHHLDSWCVITVEHLHYVVSIKVFVYRPVFCRYRTPSIFSLNKIVCKLTGLLSIQSTFNFLFYKSARSSTAFVDTECIQMNCLCEENDLCIVVLFTL
jgi:hypothetical protein